jgi:hypothetical protein
MRGKALDILRHIELFEPLRNPGHHCASAPIVFDALMDFIR